MAPGLSKSHSAPRLADRPTTASDPCFQLSFVPAPQRAELASDGKAARVGPAVDRPPATAEQLADLSSGEETARRNRGGRRRHGRQNRGRQGNNPLVWNPWQAKYLPRRQRVASGNPGQANAQQGTARGSEGSGQIKCFAQQKRSNPVWLLRRSVSALPSYFGFYGVRALAGFGLLRTVA
jgi:hypothetical protein